MHTVVAQSPGHLKTLIIQEIAAKGCACDLNHIDVSSLASFDSVFEELDFTGNIARWNVSNGRVFKNMFRKSTFNGDIADWDVRCMRFADCMFEDSKFNGDLSAWKTESLTWAIGMFKQSPFAGDLSKWRVPHLRQAADMFFNCPFNSDVSQWGVRDLLLASCMFNTKSFQQSLAAWCLPPESEYNRMVHPDYTEDLPVVWNTARFDSCLAMLGSMPNATVYLRRTPFGRVHAQLLMEEQANGWASQEMVRWARGEVEMGRAIGLEGDTLAILLVQRFHARSFPPALDISPGLFESAC